MSIFVTFLKFSIQLVLLFLFAHSAFAVEYSVRKVKPDNVFFYHQWNLQGGYDSSDPDSGWGLADQYGARTQATFEWLVKRQKPTQIGYTKFMSLKSFNFKFGLEVDPDNLKRDVLHTRLRLYGAGLKFHTKWDRTSLWLANKAIPYGHNPDLDPNFGFLPNQSSLDIGISRDPGVFFQMPLSVDWDLNVAATIGKGDPYVTSEKEDADYFEYDDTWLVSSRIGSPGFKVSEVGFTALAGTVDDGNMDLWRLGSDWAYKFAEKAKTVHQVSGGINTFHDGDVVVYNLLNNVEWFFASKWTLGVTHAARYESPDKGDSSFVGKVFGTLSYAMTRNSRLRLNTVAEYDDTVGDTDESVLLQLCYGCGLIK